MVRTNTRRFRRTAAGQRGLSNLTLLILIIIVAGFGGFLVYHARSAAHTTTAKTVTLPAAQTSQDKSTPPPVAPLPHDCTTKACFDQKFAACDPGTYTSTTGSSGEAADFGTIYYVINGPRNGRCNMLYRYTANPNADWVNKDLICDWDNKKSLEDAVGITLYDLDGSNCTGPLVQVIKQSYSNKE